MKRRQLPQITNSKWFPFFLTRCIHEFMSWFVMKIGAARPFLPIIKKGLKHADKIIVIDSKGGAGFETLDVLLDNHLEKVFVPFDDFEAKEKGLYVSVNSFHQFDENKALSILRSVSASGQPIVVVEGNNDSLWQVFGMLVIVPITVILTAPFVRPFRAERLIFTYLIPILPVVTFIDGFLALFKLYAPEDLDELTATIDNHGYVWDTGKMDNGRGGKIIYLLGHPKLP